MLMDELSAIPGVELYPDLFLFLRGGGSQLTLGVPIKTQIQIFLANTWSLLREEANVGCAQAHPAHPLPIGLKNWYEQHSFL